MKRDMELIRNILLAVEALPLPEPPDFNDPAINFLEVPGRSVLEVGRHVQLLADAGLVEAHLSKADGIVGPFGARAVRLTWNGHEFLNASRNDTIWRRTLATIREKGIDVPFSVLQEMLVAGIRASLGSGG